MIRVARGLEVKLANVPTLTLATLDGPPLGLLGANALPNGRWVWVSWTFERPANVCTEFLGRIDHIDLASGAGGLVREAQSGPWAFTFRISTQSRAAGPSERAGYGWDA